MLSMVRKIKFTNHKKTKQKKISPQPELQTEPCIQILLQELSLLIVLEYEHFLTP